MKKLVNYLPLHFLLGLIFGIILQFNYKIWHFGFIKLVITLIALVLAAFSVHRFAKKQVFKVLAFLLFTFIGISSVYIQNPKHYKNYYQNFIEKDNFGVISVDKVLKTSKYYDKFEAKVSQIDSQNTVGKILLNVKKDSSNLKLQIDDKLFLKTNFSRVKPPLNPNQFNYRSYLEKLHIYEQIFVTKDEFKILKNKSKSVNGIATNIRNYILNKLKHYNFSEDEFSVIGALLLGQRQDISNNLLTSYINAGAIHILAISGLHIGILLQILLTLFKPLERLKHGARYQFVIIILLLWGFAILTGLSASVVRAVTMFSFLTFGILIKKKKHIEHSLIASMFLLLLIKPLFVFNVGFQLSYLAVFGIVWLQPLIYQVFQSKYKPVDFIWKLISVSLAAQIGILPISLFYFHQFPCLFLLSNLFIIPFLEVILGGGVIVIFLALLGWLPDFVVNFYGGIISLLNNFISIVAHQESFLIDEISMSLPVMICWYMFIILGFQLFIKQNAKQLIYFLLVVATLQSVYIIEKFKRDSKEEFIVFHKNRNTIIGERKGKSIQLFSDIKKGKLTSDRTLQNYKVGENVSKIISNESKKVFIFKNQPILIVDSLGLYDITMKNPIVILKQSPRINLSRLISKIHPKQVVVDASNYKSYINRWKETCKKEKTPFHFTGQNGAYITN